MGGNGEGGCVYGVGDPETVWEVGEVGGEGEGVGGGDGEVGWGECEDWETDWE